MLLPKAGGLELGDLYGPFQHSHPVILYFYAWPLTQVGRLPCTDKHVTIHIHTPLQSSHTKKYPKAKSAEHIVKLDS